MNEHSRDVGLARFVAGSLHLFFGNYLEVKALSYETIELQSWHMLVFSKKKKKTPLSFSLRNTQYIQSQIPLSNFVSVLLAGLASLIKIVKSLSPRLGQEVSTRPLLLLFWAL